MLLTTSSSALLLPLLHVVVLLLCGHQGASAKTVSGLFNSRVARQSHGQFITSFMYQGASGVLVVSVDSARLAVQKESRLLLYVDMTDDGLDNLSCSDRLTKAQLTISLSEDENNQTIPRQYSPTAWQAVYVDRYTCQEGEVSLSQSDLRFTVVALNADSAGNPLDHFSAEEAGLHTFYFVLVLAYFVASCIYVQPVCHALKKGGPMHSVLKVLSNAVALQIGHALCSYAHLARYSRDGVGLPMMGSLAQLCDYISQSSMLYMLISLCVGWTLSRGKKPQSRPLQWDSSPSSTALAVGGVVAQAVLLLWDQYSSWGGSEHTGVPGGQRSMAGVLLMVLRVGLALLLAPVLYQITATERSALKRDFYLCFAKGCFLWFLCHPVLMFISVIFNEHQRMKVVTIGVILCQSISMVTLYQLFLSRSLYWEVSSLSSVSLPLTMRGRY